MLRKALRRVVISVADQGWLSLMSFVVGLAFVRAASKETYAAYTLVYAAIMLFQSVQNALIVSPMMTIVPGKDEQQRSMCMWLVSRIQYMLSALLFALWMIVGVLCMVFASDRQNAGLELVFAGAIAMLGLLLREFGRAQSFLEGRPRTALAQDLAFGALALLGLFVLYISEEVSAESVLLLTGVAGLVVGTATQLRRRREYGQRADCDAGSASELNMVKELWACAKWALPSVIASWGYANAYVYIVAALSTTSAVADLFASRLVLAPVPLLVAAWFNVFRPRASAWYHTGDLGLLLRAARLSVAGLVAGGMLYGAAAYVCFPWVERYLFGAQYAALGPLVFGWTAYFVAGAVRNVGMGCVLSSSEGFRLMHHYTWIALLFALPAIALASLADSPLAILLALAVAELIFAALVWILGWPGVCRMRERMHVAAAYTG